MSDPSRRYAGCAIALVAVCALAVSGALVVLAIISWQPFPAGGGGAAAAHGLSPAAQEENERGAGLMGQFEFAKAEDAFESAQILAPEAWIPVFNRAIARLNRSEEGAQEEAMRLLQPLAEVPATRLRARYAQGLAALYLGDARQAGSAFEEVVAARPDDAYACFYAAQCRELNGDLAGARAAYVRAGALDPLLRSSWLGVQRTAARLGDQVAADAALARFQELSEDLRSTLAEFKYTRMGPLAAVVLDSETAADPRDVAQRYTSPRNVLQDAEPFVVEGLPEGFPSERLGHPTSVDLDGDGTHDLVFAAGTTGTGLVVMGSAEGVWRANAAHPLAHLPAVGYLWGDLDNDGRVDAVVNEAGGGGVHARMQRANGEWERVDLGSESAAVALLLLDVDYDGDLDIVASGPDGPLALLGRGDGTFRSRAIGEGGGGSVERACAADVDGDGELELMLVRTAGGTCRAEVWRMGPLWQWRRAPEWEPAEPASAAIGFVGDNGDARHLVALVAGEPAPGTARQPGNTAHLAYDTLVVWAVRPAGLHEVFRRRLPGVTDITVATLEERGDPLILATGTAKPAGAVGGVPGTSFAQVFNAEGRIIQTFEGLPGLHLERATPVVIDSAGVRVLLPPASTGGALRQLRTSAPPETLAVLSFRGRVDPSQQMRTNSSGIGTACIARAGGRWSAATALPRSTVGSGLQQSLEPVVLGLNGATSASFVTVVWPDGVTQTELDVPAGARTVVETQRQISSCPVIFAWNGREHVFVTDCLGVGGLGFLAGVKEQPDGVLQPVYAPPRPWERVLMGGAEALAPREGIYEIRIGEPMEEACYLDAVRLIAVDVPTGWDVVPDERMAINGPEPTGELRAFRRSMLPVHATVTRAARNASAPPGESDAAATSVETDATSALAKRDGRAADLGPADPRFIGRLEAEAVLEMRFPALVDSATGVPVLIVDGWVEYPYGQTTFAMWQAGVPYEAPTLEALEPATGEWITLEREYGYPAGMPRRALFPIPRERLPHGCMALRLRTTMEVYFDRILVAWCEPCPELVRTEAPLEHAECAFAGFPKRIHQPQRRPDYRYAERAPLWDCRMQFGAYTAYGACTPLLSARDGALAIFGAGEEVRLRFREIQPAAEGMTRRWILETDGWCKDMDRYTGAGKLLSPLPDSSQESGARDHLHAHFNTRFEGGR